MRVVKKEVKMQISAIQGQLSNSSTGMKSKSVTLSSTNLTANKISDQVCFKGKEKEAESLAANLVGAAIIVPVCAVALVCEGLAMIFGGDGDGDNHSNGALPNGP